MRRSYCRGFKRQLQFPRSDRLTDDNPTPFNPLPHGYTPRVSAAVAFAALMAGDPPALVQRLMAAIQSKTIKALHDVGTARGQSEDEVFAIVAFTSDVTSSRPQQRAQRVEAAQRDTATT
jgi:hypothetical protein